MEIFLRYGTICVLSIVSATLCYLRVDYWGWFLVLTFAATMRLLDLPLPQSGSTQVVQDRDEDMVYACTDSDDLRSEARVRNLAFRRFGTNRAVNHWMMQKHPEFGKTPVDLIREGKTNVLVDFLSANSHLTQ